MKRCVYCQQPVADAQSHCSHCGAMTGDAVPEETKPAAYRMGPFFLNGYVVWPLADPARDVVEFQFWLGHDLIRSIRMERNLLKDLADSAATSDDTMLWKMFLVANGDEPSLAVQFCNQRRVTKLVITRSDEQDEWWNGLSQRDIIQAVGERAR